MADSRKASIVFIVLGTVAFAYALLGNYVALPGYLRFLARGGDPGAPRVVDVAFVVGAVKTIAWMYSFQLGALCFTLAHASARALPRGRIAVATLAWLTLWSVPGWPLPGAWFYAGVGGILLVVIAAALLRGASSQPSRSHETLRAVALMFFAFATWEVCGLGSTGRMLHPVEAAAPFAHALLVTQSTKLMLELAIAWVLTAWSAPRSLGSAGT